MPLPSLLIPLLLAVLLYAAYTFNRFVKLRQRLANAFSDIDVQLKRRWDLIPALVETVRGYAGHEHEVLAHVVQARTAVMAGPAPTERGGLETGLATALRGVFVLVENYPALKADRNFLELHQGLVEIEDHLQKARRYHNAVVRDLNTLRQTFPSSLIAGLFPGATGREDARYFQLDDEERAVPRIDLEGE